ncbi:MAG TPA: hypothetical protein VI365_09530 [Trebonia sp.]
MADTTIQFQKTFNLGGDLTINRMGYGNAQAESYCVGQITTGSKNPHHVTGSTVYYLAMMG